MGQNNSSTFSERRKSLRRSIRSPFPRRSRTHQSLSATFNYLDPDVKGDQLNLNTATAEELMTLPGVTRSVAQNIVEYRQAIGRFKKVEDLALVTGVGAEKLSTIRPEICVTRKKNNSNQSSRAQSMDSLDSCDGSPKASTFVDINSANVFNLMVLRGVTQELAANIVDHRERRGPFNSVEDLLRVRGMSAGLLGSLRNQLTVGPPPVGTPLPVNKKLHLALLNSSSLSRITERKPQVSNGFIPVKDIWEVLCAYSQRPPVEEACPPWRDGRPALRLASWNLTSMTIDKAENPGVREVVCRTILENKFSLVAVQEVLDPAALEKLMSELKEPRLRRMVEWRGKRGTWHCCTNLSQDKKRGCGFLFDSDTGLILRKVQVLHDSEALFTTLANFEIDGAEVTIANMFLSSSEPGDVSPLCKEILSEAQPDIAIGDFSPYPDAEFTEEGFTRVLLAPTVTNSMAPGSSGTIFMDNIYLNKRSLSRYTGVSGIVRQGLNHIAIPRGWAWGGPASEHCPVWCELYT